MPQYMLLLHEPTSFIDNMSPEEMQRIIKRYRDWRLALVEKALMRGGNKLQDGTGRVMKGKSVTDGPYVESKEVIGGYFVIEAANFDDAVAICGDCPHLDYGTIEVREVGTQFAAVMSALPINELVDHLFRRQSGRMVSTLTSIFGPKNLQLAEDVVQEALVRALQLWPFQGVPQNPKAWLIQIARNLALDRLRRETSLTAKIPELERRMHSTPEETLDEQMAMMFLCCHPQLPEQARVCLTLKIVAGFGVTEIARAFLAREDAIAQRIVRAKRQIREEDLRMEVPDARELPARLDSVLEALYLIFNEGYSASAGESLLRRDLCEEAIYLTGLLASNPAWAAPKVHALFALQMLQAARLDTRTDASGNLLLLEDQNRSLWDRSMIARGFHHLDRASCGEELTSYHLQAGIAAAHASASSLAATDWEQIVSLYDHLAEFSPSPVVMLNRAVAITWRDGPRAGLDALEPVRGHPALANYYLLFAVTADLHQRIGENEAARQSYEAALRCPCNAAERRFLMGQAAGLPTTPATR